MNVIVEVDSKFVIELLQQEHLMIGPHGMLIAKCKELLHRDWSVQMQHAYRECNMVAYWIANEATKMWNRPFSAS